MSDSKFAGIFEWRKARALSNKPLIKRRAPAPKKASALLLETKRAPAPRTQKGAINPRQFLEVNEVGLDRL